MCIDKSAGSLHCPYAPIDIGRETVLQVVERSNVTAHEKGLMAHKHPTLETLPGEFFGSLQTAHPYEVTLLVDLGSFAIKNFGQGVIAFESGNHTFKGVGGIERVAGIKEAQIVALCKFNALVHCVVKAAVVFAHYVGELNSHTHCLGHSVVGGGTVDEQILEVLVALHCHTAQSGLYHRGGVMGDCYY